MKLPKKIYHVSFNGDLPSKLRPRKPHSDKTKEDKESVFYEDLPPRISFASNIRRCIIAIYPNIGHFFDDPKFNYPYMDLYVYGAILTDKYKTISEDVLKKELNDYHITKEICLLESIVVDKVGKIRLFNDGEDAKKIYYYPFKDKRNGSHFISPEPRFEVLEQYDNLYSIDK